MKLYADQKRSEREFKVGDWVYLRLQPYRQTSVELRSNTKLSANYYDPYQVMQKIGNVAYRLKLPEASKIHLVTPPLLSKANQWVSVGRLPNSRQISVQIPFRLNTILANTTR